MAHDGQGENGALDSSELQSTWATGQAAALKPEEWAVAEFSVA